MMRKVVQIAAAVALAATLTLPAAADQSATTVTASAPAAVAAGTPIVVTGNVTFALDRILAVEDATGDTQTTPNGTGNDITKGFIVSDPAKPKDLTFEMHLASLPAGGMPEAYIYEWDVLVDEVAPGGAEQAGVNWRRTSAWNASLTPYISLQKCTSGSCNTRERLTGEMNGATGVLKATTRYSQLGAKGGELLSSTGLKIYHGTSAGWFPGMTSDDAFMEESYRLPTRVDAVKLAVVPASAPTPSEFTATATPSGSGTTGSYSAQVSTMELAPGAYEVVVQACWGTNCGEARAPVTVS